MTNRIVSEQTKSRISKSKKGVKNYKVSIALTGRKITGKHLNNIRRANAISSHKRIGQKRSDECKQRMSKACMGRKHSEETKRKLSESHRGERSPFWRGGINSLAPDGEQIRRSVEMRWRKKECFIKYNFTCQKCGQFGGDLAVHHINNFADFPELRLDTNNGIILCKKCHLDYHRIYGKNNNTREQLYDYIMQEIKSA